MYGSHKPSENLNIWVHFCLFLVLTLKKLGLNWLWRVESDTTAVAHVLLKPSDRKYTFAADCL